MGRLNPVGQVGGLPGSQVAGLFWPAAVRVRPSKSHALKVVLAKSAPVRSEPASTQPLNSVPGNVPPDSFASMRFHAASSQAPSHALDRSTVLALQSPIFDVVMTARRKFAPYRAAPRRSWGSSRRFRPDRRSEGRLDHFVRWPGRGW